jgi:hypothetical protein
VSQLRPLWQRYLTWRVSGPPPPVADTRPPMLKADVDPEFVNGQSRALSMEMPF